MDGLFASQQYIDITVYWKVEKTKSGMIVPVILTEEEYHTLAADETTKAKTRALKTQWRIPNWKVANEILESATIFNYHKQEMEVNWNKHRDQRFKMSLIGWDAKEENGEPIPCNAETINTLHPDIALALVAEYNKAISADTEAQEKN